MAILAMTSASWGMGLQAARADATNPKSAADCRAVTDFDLRGKCWDALDNQSQKDVQDIKEEKKHAFGLGLHAPSISAILPNREQKEREAKIEREEIRNQTLTLASVEGTAIGRLLLTATDGAVWEQTDTDRVNNPPNPGDTVEVSKGMMGGFMCQVSRWEKVRCQRDR
jgi:hypothetical protein